jgi:hypothetical protein
MRWALLRRQALARLPTPPKWKHLQSKSSPLASGLPLQRRGPCARGIKWARRTGTGNGDTIVLPAGAVFTFDHFWDGDAHNYMGPTATPIIFSKIVIEGNGAMLQWVDHGPAPGNSRLFAIGPVNESGFAFTGTGDLTLTNAYVKGFHVKGGDGGDSGGGGLGAGGAIYVMAARLTIENVTFENNGAVGGNGGGTLVGTSGGGGGLSGNGGQGCSNSGGGGGGSRGNGGKGGAVSQCLAGGGGGGGGGTVFSGGDGASASAGSSGVGGASGFRCGGNGGDAGHDGHKAGCLGGGGGGGGGSDDPLCGFTASCKGDGARGGYGGGGGGGVADGGHGGFGGGGGAAFFAPVTLHGGDGGFGGGGGAAFPDGAPIVRQGRGGPFGGNADESQHGGGGGALGGAIFNHNGNVQVRNSTFFNNFVTRGVGGGGSADNGADAGGAIFSVDNSLQVENSTFSGNQNTGSGGAIVVTWSMRQPVKFILSNSIIANNGANECFFFAGFVNAVGGGNLIMNNGSGTGFFPRVLEW